MKPNVNWSKIQKKYQEIRKKQGSKANYLINKLCCTVVDKFLKGSNFLV